MDSLSFKEIPQENKSTINFIVNETIIKLYSKFDFLYFHEIIADHENEKQDVIQNFIFNYLKNYKFITYQIHENPHINLINAIFCVEGTCLIISEINITILLNLISYLKKEGISILYFRNEFQKIEGFVEDEKFHEEIKNFCSYPKFRSDISKHRFVNDTIGPMIGYMIRRFFYPTSYFKDKTFFIFNNSKSINEGSLKEKITNFLFPKKEEITINLQDFEESDFIILRNEYLKFNATFYLAIHIESFHIFMMKKINDTKEFKHEIYFCQNYSHRCLTHFYGFIKNEGEIKGFIYEYMCNGTLESIVSKNSKIDDDNFKLIIINRIFQGICFLHSKSLIHRDIKPLNVLFDHDFLPYVSDFDSICKATDEPDKGEKTKDLGTTDYMSPEQYIGEFISFPTDIFSFGLVIYYIYEKKHMRKISDFYSILKLTKGSDSIKNLCSKCTKLIPLERAKKEEIKTIIFGEAISIIQKQFFSINILNLDQYILDGIAIQIDNKQNISKFLLEIGDMHYFIDDNKCRAIEYYELSGKLNNSEVSYKLGNIYFKGNHVKSDFAKARKYFELSGELNIPEVLNVLGDIYYHGLEVTQDYGKSKEYYKMSARLDNSTALIQLGFFYAYCPGHEKDFLEVKKYFDLAAEKGDSYAYLYLGLLYQNGDGVEKDHKKAKEYYMKYNYEKAKEYYEKSSKKKYYALYKLGYFYDKGLGVAQNFLRAKEFYESTNPYYSFSLIKIGTFYQNGHGVKQDYLEAKKYYALSAQLNNSIGFYKIGNLYRKGKGVPKNFERAIYFYELSAKLVNSFAFFYLGVLYSSDDIPKKNITKALFYYLKCSEIIDERVKSVNPIDNSVTYLERYNKYCYHSFNNIGLIYLINFEDYQKAFIYIIQSAKGKLPFGQNNLGLLNEFYNNDSHKAKYFYKKSAKRNFSLAEYNLGHLKEKDGEIEESIEYFTKALEDSALTFRKHQPYDKQIEISKMFIICLTNLKLAEYYFKQDLFNESKEYFKNSILKLESFENLTHSFRFTFNSKDSMNLFHYIEEYILNFQLFNLPNQPNFITVMEDIQADLNRRKTKTPKRQIYNKERNDSKSLYKIKKEETKEDTDAMNKILSNEDNKFEYENQFNSNFESNENLYLEDIGNEMVFEDPADLFDYVIQNKEYKNEFLNEIRDIIKKMNKFLYTYPYQILFGRINTEKPKPKIENTDNFTLEDINQEFSEGLDLNEF